jgi:hypothetical protein
MPDAISRDSFALNMNLTFSEEEPERISFATDGQVSANSGKSGN